MFFEKEFEGIDEPNLANNQEIGSNYLNLQENENFEENFERQQNNPQNEILISNQTQMNSINNDGHTGNFQALQNRILELEARIHDLEFEKQSVSIHNNTNSTVSNSVFSTLHNTNLFQDYKIKINDFSPEWDFVEGGTKMMICFSPNLLIPTEDQVNKLTILFGDVEARAFCIQPGVIKCYGEIFFINFNFFFCLLIINLIFFLCF